uniref:DUSP domain-containing protein n=1 Tax=Phytophthora ramorum TaxID=164328 RepID=H3HB32_PHYRM
LLHRLLLSLQLAHSRHLGLQLRHLNGQCIVLPQFHSGRYSRSHKLLRLERTVRQRQHTPLAPQPLHWWQRVVERGETPSDTRIRNGDIVDASRSCRCCSRSILKPNLMEDVDFRLVAERVWGALSMEFGYDWAVRREVVTMGRRLGVDVYPAGLEERATGHGHISTPADEALSPKALEQWRSELETGQMVDALDTDSKWYEARIVNITDNQAKVHYRGWSIKWDEWLARTSPRLMPLHSKVRDWRRFRVDDEVQVGETRPGKKRILWRDAKVLSTVKSLLVQLQVDDEVHWMDAQDERLCPPASLSSPTSITTAGSSSNNSTPTARLQIQIPTSSFKATPTSMAAFETDVEGARGDTWALPDWEEYSEVASSIFAGDWSDVEADVSLDTASSVASTEHQREPPPGSKEKQVESELLAQQSEISTELQAVRRQLSDFQDKWRKAAEGRADGEMQSSGAPTVARETVAAQTERGEREDAVKQWLQLLTHKLEALTRKYSHEPTLQFQAAMVHLGGLDSSKKDAKDTSEGPSNNDGGGEDDISSLSSWHFLELEQAIACMNGAVEQHERRQMTNFDRAVQQVQGYHHERMQRVVNESLAELKLVRGRYKKKEAQLEDELRAANKEVEQWKRTATDAEHRKKLDQETLEFQLSSAKEQHDHACRRYEDAVAQLNNQLKTLRAERKQVAKEGAEALERQCQALKKQQERTKELHDRELRILHDTIRQLRDSNDEMETQHCKEKQALAGTIEKIKTLQQAEAQKIEAQVRSDIEQQMLCELLPEKMANLEKRHEEAISAMTAEHKRQLSQLEAQLDEVKLVEPSSALGGDNQAQEQVEELSRRCRALEKLLDKKFEDTPRSLSSSHEATLGAHEMWDSASFTSIDTVDDLSLFASQRTTPRHPMRSTQGILTLVRQIKHAASPLAI